MNRRSMAIFRPRQSGSPVMSRIAILTALFAGGDTATRTEDMRGRSVTFARRLQGSNLSLARQLLVRNTVSVF